jgi:hypothetical protein
MTKSKVQSLINEFPFLEAILKKYYNLTLDTWNLPRYLKFNIKVARMDENLLYFTGDYLDGKNGALLREKQQGALYYDVYFVDNSKVTFESKLRDRQSPFLKEDIYYYFFEHKTYPEYIIKCKEVEWYNATCEEQVIEQNLSSIERTITIYKQPIKTLREMMYGENMMFNVNLTTDMVIKFAIESSDEWKVIEPIFRSNIATYKHFFEANLQSHIYHSKKHSHVYAYDGLTVRIMAMAGRCITTIEEDSTHDQVSFIGLDEPSGDTRMGDKSIDCTLLKAKQMVDKFIADYVIFESFETAFAEKAVGYAGTVIE